ncbi:MAG: ABC transporter permease [Oscillospiraceae bacterium]|nr:ABC transporter permease [Oscillospiraceae bacterium]
MKTKGWQKVFSFTFIQYVKTKSFIISTIIMALLVAAMFALVNILPVALSKNDDSGEIGSIDTIFNYERVYIVDETGVITDEGIAELFANGLKAERTDKSADDIVAQVAKTEGVQAAVVFTADKNTNGDIISYTQKTFYSPNGGNMASSLSAAMTEFFRNSNVKRLGIDPEAYAQSQIGINTRTIEAGQEELNVIAGMLHYIIPIIVSLVLFMLIFVYGNTIAQSIAIEKTSRVMELLLTSVRPLAVVIGKVLAMGLVSFAQFLLIVVVGAGSMAISAPFGIMGQIAPLLSNPELLAGGMANAAASGVDIGQFSIAQAVGGILEKFTPVNILLIVLTFIIGFLFYALLAALVGASVSRMEDLQAAMQPYSLIGVVGFFLAYYPIMFNAESLADGSSGTNSVQIFSYYFPISSPFSLPSAIILGQFDAVQGAVAVAILAVFTVLVAMLVSKVYEAIILHNGSRLKVGDILKLAKNK